MFTLTIFFTNKYNFWIVSGLANFDSATNINYRYFQPERSAPRFVNQGGQTIKVKVGDTVTIPCKIQNKGKHQKYTLWQKPKISFLITRLDESMEYNQFLLENTQGNNFTLHPCLVWFFRSGKNSHEPNPQHLSHQWPKTKEILHL